MSSPEESAETDPTSDAVSFPLAPGTLVNGIYRLVRQLDVGGMGQVWEARHELAGPTSDTLTFDVFVYLNTSR
jgi:hypothetical protein